MARTISLPISDRLEALIKARAQSRGFASLDECILAILHEALINASLPSVPADPQQLVAELRKGLDGAGTTPSRDDWDRKKARLSDQTPRSKAG